MGMSWITKADQKFDNPETVLDMFKNDATPVDRTTVKATNAGDISETWKMLNLLVVTLLPFLVCSVYIGCLRYLAMLMLKRSSTNIDPETSEKQMYRKLSGFSGLTLLQLLMFILMLLLVVSVTDIHLEILESWKISKTDTEDLYTEHAAHLIEKSDESFKRIMDFTGDETDVEQDKVLDEFKHAAQAMFTLDVTAANHNDDDDLDNKMLAVVFSFCFISSSIISIWLWLHVISKEMYQMLFMFFITAISCIMFITIALTAMYVNIVQPDLINHIHPDSSFIQEQILEIGTTVGKQIVQYLQNLQLNAFIELFSVTAHK